MDMYQKLRNLSPAISSIKDEDQTWTIENLRQHLQIAIELEHSTIPPYLCALYSIAQGKNPEAVRLIHSVIMDEMLHMTLAANVLNAIGGAPSLNTPDFIPSYPMSLPHSKRDFTVHLARFCPDTVKTFLNIERPAKRDAPSQSNNYETIGQFYQAIEDGLKHLCKGDRYFINDDAKQVTPELFYGGGDGGIVVVKNLESALKALSVIVSQGEGVDRTIFDGGDLLFDDDRDLAHYFRFNEIYLGQRYTCEDNPDSYPSGQELAVDWDASYPMRCDPKTDDYPAGSELRQKSDQFNGHYTSLLQMLHQAYNGEPQSLRAAVGAMYELKYQAIALMRIPFGDKGETAGPSFEFHPSVSINEISTTENAYPGDCIVNEKLSGPRLPTIPACLSMPFYYSSLTNCAVFYRVDPCRLSPYLKNKGVEAVLFDAKGVVSFNYQLYTAQFDWGMSVVSEVELNILVYPTSEASKVPEELSFQEFVLGNEQTKNMGYWRMHVPCDNEHAIDAGRRLFDEPKFQTTFTTELPSLNDEGSSGSRLWKFTCRDPAFPESDGHCIFSCEADLRKLDAIAANCSPITVYGFYKKKLVGARWNILQPFSTYFIDSNEHKRIKLSYGQSTHKMKEDMNILIGNSPAVALQTLQSPPVSIQSRAYYA